MKEILVVPHLHFDPVWRRCFDKPSVYNGVTVRSYAEVEELCIDSWLKVAKTGYPHSDGQTAIWRKYLERNPDKLSALKKEAKAGGTLDLVYAGEVVPDTNMPTAEGLVRNFLVSLPVYQQLTDADHPGLKLAWLEDAFGNSANYPQILVGVGAEVACATSYRFCPDPIWTGIDGTQIYCYDHFPAVRTGGFEKHPPCPECSGKGCPTCDGKGLLLIPGLNMDTLRTSLDQARDLKGDWSVVYYLIEEILPDPNVKPVMDEFNRRNRGKAQARFANPSDIYARYLPQLKRLKAKWKKTGPTPELNPAMPGCYVTRIRTKQRTRASAYLLLAAESVLANEAWKKARTERPPANFAQAWQDVCFNQFHDAITGTHIDSGYVELMEMLDRADAIAAPHLKAVKKSPAPKFVENRIGEGKAKLGKFDLTFDRKGLLSVRAKGQDVFGTLPGFNGLSRAYRIGELVLDADFGDAWGQRIAPFPEPGKQATRVNLGDYQTRVETSPEGIRWLGRYNGGDPLVKKLTWTVTLSLSPDSERLNFVTDVDWDTNSRRLRVIVPVNSKEDTATYEIPYGFLDRQYDAAKLDYSQWRANSMEFPTLHWARKAVDRRSGVALLNKGLPCVRWMPGQFDLSLLRSPQWSFCAVEPANYEFWDTDGQRDTGRHRFEYSIWPYFDTLTEHALTCAGYAYNLPRPLETPFELGGNAIVTAWKLAEDGSGWIVRLQETAGQASKALLKFNRAVSLTPTDLLERPTGQPVNAAQHSLELHRHAIRTFLVKFGDETSR